MFEQIKNDKEIINIYNMIGDMEDKEKGWAYHNYAHVINVTNIVERVLLDLKFDDKYIESAKIASMLHDVGALEGKEGHAYRSYEFAKEYFRKKDIKLNDEQLILDAIRIHSDGFDTDNVIALALIFADKLDIKKTRVAEEGKNIEGMRQIMYIDDINIEIDDKKLNVYFKVSDDINIKELNEFYFTKKVFKAIESFAKKFGLLYMVYINDDVWEFR